MPLQGSAIIDGVPCLQLLQPEMPFIYDVSDEFCHVSHSVCAIAYGNRTYRYRSLSNTATVWEVIYKWSAEISLNWIALTRFDLTPNATAVYLERSNDGITWTNQFVWTAPFTLENNDLVYWFNDTPPALYWKFRIELAPAGRIVFNKAMLGKFRSPTKMPSAKAWEERYMAKELGRLRTTSGRVFAYRNEFPRASYDLSWQYIPRAEAGEIAKHFTPQDRDWTALLDISGSDFLNGRSFIQGKISELEIEISKAAGFCNMSLFFTELLG